MLVKSSKMLAIKKKFFFVYIYVLLNSTGYCYVFKPGPLIPMSKGEIWPAPKYQNNLDEYYFSFLSTKFTFQVKGYSCGTLEEALKRYTHIFNEHDRLVKTQYYTFRQCNKIPDYSFAGVLKFLNVELTAPCNDNEYPTIGMIESYSLEVSLKTKNLSSSSLWGILRGLESFSQLIHLSDDFACHKIKTVLIKDHPKLAHRGLLLDTSRHYIPKEKITKLIDAMSYNKLNVFHWHITDDYSFPYESITYPELSEKGAFHSTLFTYNQEFVAHIQNYARNRGIRVLVEFDTPGHTLSWGLGAPQLLTACQDVPRLKWGPINPAKESTYAFIFKLFAEINQVFKDRHIHLGGDEVDYSCWKSNAEILNYMRENGIENDFVALQSFYTQKLLNFITSLNLTSIVWEEVFTNGVILPKETIVNVWKNDDPKNTLHSITKAGYKAILSSYWYLDIINSNRDWPEFYRHDPLDFSDDPAQRMLVVGAEACMWSEMVNEHNLESRVWPRACAAAEKFWSDVQPFGNEEQQWAVAGRLEEQACRMNRREIGAQPPNGPSICL